MFLSLFGHVPHLICYSSQEVMEEIMRSFQKCSETKTGLLKTVLNGATSEFRVLFFTIRREV
jgi:hypothetical protein